MRTIRLVVGVLIGLDKQGISRSISVVLFASRTHEQFINDVKNDVRKEQLFARDVTGVESIQNILNIWFGEQLKRMHLNGSTKRIQTANENNKH